MLLAMFSALEMLFVLVIGIGFLVGAIAIGFAIYALIRRAARDGARDAHRPPEL